MGKTIQFFQKKLEKVKLQKILRKEPITVELETNAMITCPYDEFVLAWYQKQKELYLYYYQQIHDVDGLKPNNYLVNLETLNQIKAFSEENLPLEHSCFLSQLFSIETLKEQNFTVKEEEIKKKILRWL